MFNLLAINSCASSPCLNGGICVSTQSGYACQCIPGYTGANCQIYADMCASGPCLNGGTCNNILSRFVCKNYLIIYFYTNFYL